MVTNILIAIGFLFTGMFLGSAITAYAVIKQDEENDKTSSPENTNLILEVKYGY